MTTTTKFQVGETYAQRFMCDYDSIAYFTIKARTAKSVTLDVNGKTVRRFVSISSYDDAERMQPFGSYSMSMVVSAKDTADKITR